MQGKTVLVAVAVALGAFAVVGLNQAPDQESNQVARIVQAPVPLNPSTSGSAASTPASHDQEHSGQQVQLTEQMSYAVINGLLYLFNVSDPGSAQAGQKTSLVCGANLPANAKKVELTGWALQPYNDKAALPGSMLAQPDGQQKLICTVLTTPPPGK